MVDRIPPHNLDAEESVIGSCLIDSRVIDKIPFLAPEHFYRDKNQWTYTAILSVSRQGGPVDEVTVAHELKESGKLEVVGGAAYLSNTILNTPVSVHAEYYARIVWRLAGQREIIRASGVISDIGYDSQKPTISEALSAAEEQLFRLRADYSSDDDRAYYHDEGMQAYLEMQANATIKPWLTTPWGGYNDMVRMRNGKAVTIAAPSGQGKTTFCEQLSEWVASKLGRNVLYLFNELDIGDFYNRRACRLMATSNGRAPSLRALEDGIHAESMEMASLVVDVMSWPGKTTLVDCTGWNVYRICAEIRQKVAQGLADVVILDYLQLIPPTSLKESRARQLGSAFQLLKQTCRTVKGQPPLIVVSQVNRPHHMKGESRELKKSDFSLESLRDSGEIGEYSNVVTFIFNQWDATKGGCIQGCTMNRESESGCTMRCTWLITVKNTFGPKGEVLVKQIPYRFKFVEEHDANPKLL